MTQDELKKIKGMIIMQLHETYEVVDSRMDGYGRFIIKLYMGPRDFWAKSNIDFLDDKGETRSIAGLSDSMAYTMADILRRLHKSQPAAPWTEPGNLFVQNLHKGDDSWPNAVDGVIPNPLHCLDRLYSVFRLSQRANPNYLIQIVKRGELFIGRSNIRLKGHDWVVATAESELDALYETAKRTALMFHEDNIYDIGYEFLHPNLF
jgi:hypothetical protein